MSVTLKSGTSNFIIAAAAVAKHPDSLLHSMVTAVGDDNDDSAQGITLDTGSPSFASSPFAGWREAARMTAELYSSGHFSAATLSAQLRTQTAAGLAQRLQTLLDYLALPGPLARWLPTQVTLQHVGVLGLPYHPPALQAAQDMLSAVVVDGKQASYVNHSKVAAFIVTRPAPADSRWPAERFNVFAVPVEPVLKGGPIQFAYEAEARLLGSSSTKQSVALGDVVCGRGAAERFGIPWGRDCDEQDRPQWAALISAVNDAVSSIPVSGQTGRVRCEVPCAVVENCYETDRSTGFYRTERLRDVRLWVVCWGW